MFFSALLFLFYFFAINAAIEETENDVKKRILTSPNISDSPINPNDPLILEIGLQPRRIVDFDFHQSTLTIDGFLYMSWFDKRLKWNISNAPDWISLQKNTIWKPVLNIFNRAKPKKALEVFLSMILPDGHVYNSDYQRIHTVCVPTARYFPFDVHKCQIIAGFSIAEGIKTNLTYQKLSNEVRWDFFHKGNPRWNLISFNAAPVYYKLVDGSYPCVSITFEFNRTVPQLALIIMCPILVCALLGLLPFLLPPDSGAKYRLLLSIAALVVVNKIIDFLNEVLPLATKETPIIVNYALTCLVLLWVSTAHTFVVATIVRWSSSPPSFLIVLVSSRASQWLLRYSLMGNFSENNKTSLVDEMQSNEDVHSVNNDHVKFVFEWRKVTVLLDVLGFNTILVSYILFSLSVVVIL